MDYKWKAERAINVLTESITYQETFAEGVLSPGIFLIILTQGGQYNAVSSSKDRSTKRERIHFIACWAKSKQHLSEMSFL
jgi:hypothetical protein